MIENTPPLAEPEFASEPKADRNPLSVGAALLQGMRPRQLPKNALLFAGLLFTLDKHPSLADALQVFYAFLLFCVLSGCVYLLNDAIDAPADRLHPKKRLRPIASGRLPINVALAFVTIAVPSALTLAWMNFSTNFFWSAVVYFALTVAYTFGLKHVVIVDVMAVAAGFVLRAVAGTTVITVPSSQWLLICTGLLALFIAIAKRRSEYVQAQETAIANGGTVGETRKILAFYALPLLDQMLTIVATSCLLAYFLYAFQSETGQHHPYLLATTPFVLYGLFRYLYLLHVENKGDAPEEILLKDRPMLANVLLWVAAVVVAVVWG